LRECQRSVFRAAKHLIGVVVEKAGAAIEPDSVEKAGHNDLRVPAHIGVFSE